MSFDRVTHYRDLVLVLLKKRELAEGELPQAEEADAVAELDLYWNEMTLAERVVTEEWFATQNLERPQ